MQGGLVTAIYPHSVSAALRHVVPAAVIASALALGFPAVANAEWDIQKYDNCMAQPHGPATGSVWEEQYAYNCCVDSGGQWSEAGHKCVAPPVNEEGPWPTSSRPLPPGAVNPGPPVMANQP